MSTAVRARVKHLVQRVALISLASALGLCLLAYLVDYAVFRYRVATNRQPFGQVAVTTYDAVAQKNGKTQFIFNDPQTQICANSLFPRQGYVACWYLKRHNEQRTNI